MIVTIKVNNGLVVEYVTDAGQKMRGRVTPGLIASMAGRYHEESLAVACELVAKALANAVAVDE